MFWTLQAPHGAAWQLWQNNSVRLCFADSQAHEVLQWLKQYVQACENSLIPSPQYVTEEPQQAPQAPPQAPPQVQRRVIPDALLRPAEPVIPGLKGAVHPGTVQPAWIAKSSSNPPIHSAHQGIPPSQPIEVSVMSVTRTDAPMPIEQQLMVSARAGVPPERPPAVEAASAAALAPPIESATRRPNLDSIRPGTTCPCGTELTGGQEILEHWNAGHLDVPR